MIELILQVLVNGELPSFEFECRGEPLERIIFSMENLLPCPIVARILLNAYLIPTLLLLITSINLLLTYQFLFEVILLLFFE